MNLLKKCKILRQRENGKKLGGRKFEEEEKKLENRRGKVPREDEKPGEIQEN